MYSAIHNTGPDNNSDSCYHTPSDMPKLKPVKTHWTLTPNEFIIKQTIGWLQAGMAFPAYKATV